MRQWNKRNFLSKLLCFLLPFTLALPLVAAALGIKDFFSDPGNVLMYICEIMFFINVLWDGGKQ